VSAEDRRHDCQRSTGRPTISEVTGTLARGNAIEDVLHNLTAASLALIRGADCAKLSVIDNGVLRSTAATSELAVSLDTPQQVARRGPCLEAISTRKAICCDDLRTDARWPEFSPIAVTAGVRSVMCCPIDTPEDGGATLSLFGFQTEAFGPESETIGAVLADHASIALLNQRQEREFQTALATRDVIGQAKGTIMERFGVDAQQAFTMLTALSQNTNTPVRDLAAKLVNPAGKALLRTSQWPSPRPRPGA
jgi:transcriptional regulator with GAF, ATPase, and Fis domain